MSSSVKVISGSLYTDTSSHSYTSSGFGTPKAAILFVQGATSESTITNNNLISFCFVDSTNVLSVSGADINGISPTSCARSQRISDLGIYKADRTIVTGTVSLVTDGISITWSSAPDASYRFFAILFNGNISTKSNIVLYDQAQNAEKTESIGFVPDIMFFMSTHVSVAINNGSTTADKWSFGYCDSNKTQGSINFYSKNSETTTDVATSIFDNRIISRPDAVNYFEVSTLTSTMGITKRGSSDNIAISYLAIKFESGEGGKVVKFSSPEGTGNSTVTGVPGRPFGNIIIGTCCAAYNTTYSTDVTSNGGVGFSCFTKTDQYAISTGSRDGANPSSTRSVISPKAIRNLRKEGASNNVASYYSMNSSGFTLNWEEVDVTSSAYHAISFYGPKALRVGLQSINLI